MIVSRRSMLLAHPSNSVMRAAGRAASMDGVNAAFQTMAEQRYAALTGAKPKPTVRLSPEAMARAREIYAQAPPAAA